MNETQEEIKKLRDALHLVQIACCYPQTEDISCDRDEVLTYIRKIATEGLGEEWKG